MSGLIRLERYYRAQLEDGASAAEAVTYVDRYGRTVASCRADVNDIGEWLLGEGLALEWPRYSKGRYGEAQRQAESAGRGMWAGSYVEPWQYRACVRAGGHPAECSMTPPCTREIPGRPTRVAWNQRMLGYKGPAQPSPAAA